MARLWSSGAELNTITTAVEFTTTSSTPQISTTTVRSGRYAGRTASASRFVYDTHSSATQGVFYVRFYFRVATAPSFDQHVIRATPPSLGASNIDILINSSRALELWNNEDSAQIGSDSSALSLDTWYRIELKVDTTTLASTAIEARIDGTAFASGIVNLADGIGGWTFGGQNGGAGEVFYYDDIAINDSTGSFQNSYPGAGQIVHLRPVRLGDNDEWDPNTSGNGFQDIDEVTPDNATTFIDTTTLDNVTDVGISPIYLASDATVSCVQLGVRFAGEANGSSSAFVLRIKASSGGTVEESSNIVASSTTYNTNATATPRNYPLTLYDLPGASTTAWTTSALKTTQIGVRMAVEDGLESPRVSTLWLLVDYVQGSGMYIETVTSDSVTSASSRNTTMLSRGTNRELVVLTSSWDGNATHKDISSITFNGDALSKVIDNVQGEDNVEIWHLTNPDEVSGTLAVTMGGTSDFIGICAVVFANAKQTDQTDASNSADEASTTEGNVSVTTVADLAWVLAVAASTGEATLSYGTSQTEIANLDSSFTTMTVIRDVTPAGATDSSFTADGSTQYTLAAVSIKPVAVEAGTAVKDIIGMGFIPFAR